MTNQTLRALVDLRDRQIQKARIQFGNRADAIASGSDESSSEQAAIINRWLKTFNQLEKDLDNDIANMVKGFPIYNHVVEVRGIGPMLSAKIISMIDINRANTVSALWRYSGYAVFNGKRERPVKGEKLKYNKRLKTTCYLIGTSFLRLGSPYRDIYDSSKEYYQANREDWPKLHIHNAAMLKMNKRFLSHFWLTWRTI